MRLCPPVCEIGVILVSPLRVVLEVKLDTENALPQRSAQHRKFTIRGCCHYRPSCQMGRLRPRQGKCLASGCSSGWWLDLCQRAPLRGSGPQGSNPGPPPLAPVAATHAQSFYAFPRGTTTGWEVRVALSRCANLGGPAESPPGPPGSQHTLLPFGQRWGLVLIPTTLPRSLLPKMSRK